MELRRIISPDITASAVAHVSLLTLLVLFSEVHPFGAVTAEQIPVEIVTPQDVPEQPAEQQAAEIRPDGAFEGRYRRLWFDTHLNSSRSEAFFVETVGRDRLVYGTNFVGWDAPDADAGHRPEPDLADNARRLLRAGRKA